MTELPLFPLSSVLLPFGKMPLQIFEPRYIDLVRDCMRRNEGFGVVWIRRGSEVAQRGKAEPKLGDYGTVAHIVDWDQLDNGLLGITIEGRETFTLHGTHTRSNGLVVGDVEITAQPEPAPMREQWDASRDVLRGLENHPHVQRINLHINYNNA